MLLLPVAAGGREGAVHVPDDRGAGRHRPRRLLPPQVPLRHRAHLSHRNSLSRAAARRGVQGIQVGHWRIVKFLPRASW